MSEHKAFYSYLGNQNEKQKTGLLEQKERLDLSKQARSNQALGLLLMLIGAFFLALNLGWLSLSQSGIWPFFIIAPGLLLMVLAISTSARNSILPGVILTGVGLFFLLRQWGLLPWSMDLLWPVFPGIVGIAFIATYQVAGRDKGLLLPAFILLTIALVFLAINFNLLNRRYLEFWPVLLILAGVYLLIPR